MYKQYIGVDGQVAKGINKLNANGSITGVPFDPDNTDYQQYLKWVEAGNTPLPADEGAA